MEKTETGARKQGGFGLCEYYLILLPKSLRIDLYKGTK